MKPDIPENHDEALDRALRRWDLKETLAPRFQERVWRRISQLDAAKRVGVWQLLSSRVSMALARPSLAAGYVTVLLLTGLVAGYWQARTERAHTLQTLSARYVQMMDPYRTRP
jgi:hypothetical protein